jgi:hypothetical protein
MEELISVARSEINPLIIKILDDEGYIITDIMFVHDRKIYYCSE